MNESQSFSNSTSPPMAMLSYFTEPLGIVIARLSFEVLIALAGLVGNILVCIVIASKRLRGRVSLHSFLLNLAFADIGVLTIIFPTAIMKERMPFYWPLGKVVCLYILPTVDTFYGASIWFITSIAFQRYRNIVKASENMHRTKSKHLKWYLVGIWIVSFMVVSFPLLFIMDYIVVDPASECYCILSWSKVSFMPLEPVYILTLVVFTYVLPLSIISWTYFGIWREIRTSTKFHQSMSGTGSSRADQTRVKENSRAKKILTPIVVTFAVCMLPVNIFRILAICWKPLFTIYHFWTFYNFMVIITTANSAVNPLIYSIVSREFRRAFIEILLNRKKSFMTTTSKMNGHLKYSQDGSQRKRALSISTKNWPEVQTLKETDI